MEKNYANSSNHNEISSKHSSDKVLRDIQESIPSGSSPIVVDSDSVSQAVITDSSPPIKSSENHISAPESDSNSAGSNIDGTNRDQVESINSDNSNDEFRSMDID